MQKILGGTGLLGSIAPNLAKVEEATAERSLGNPGLGYIKPDILPSSNWMPWVLAALPGFGLWYWVAGSAPQQVALPTSPKIMVDNKNIGDQFGGAIRDLCGALNGISNAASANAALPKLRNAPSEMDRLQKLSGQLSGDAKTQFSSYVAQLLPLAALLIESLANNNAIGPIIKPFLGPIASRLNEMARA